MVDLHPSYSALNQAIFDEADRILVPVTPDVPAIRAAVQLRDVAVGLGCRERAGDGRQPGQQRRLRGRHGADASAMPALGQIRSGGLLFVRAANEGRTVIEMFPREKITDDFDVLADRVLGRPEARGQRPHRLPLPVTPAPARA